MATGAAVAAVVGRPPRRHRYPPPRRGYIYLMPVAGQPPRAVRAEEGSFIIMRTTVPTFQHGADGGVVFEVQITMNDGYKYSVTKRYSQFEQLRESVARLLRAVTPPFPPKHGMRSATVGLGQPELEERRQMLQAWLQSLCTSASTNTPALRLPLYDFLETVTYYPPGEPVSDSAGGAAAAAPAPAATATPAAYTSNEVPYATATPYAQPMDPAGASLPLPQPPHEPARASDGWAVPVESREASDVKLAMSGPDSYGRLVAAKAAAALREGTGATSDDLRAVWELSDIDKDGMLDRDEFALAWYLANQAAAGVKPPSSLPANLVPLSKRAAAPRSAANPF